MLPGERQGLAALLDAELLQQMLVHFLLGWFFRNVVI